MLEIIQEIYSELTGDYEKVITPKTKLDEGVELSSLGKVELLCEVEDRFDIEIPAAEIKNFKTVKDVLVYLEKNVENR